MFAACSSKQPMSSVSVPHIARSYTPASSAGKKTRRRRENDVPLFRVHARRPVWVASALQKCKRHCHERFNTFQRVKLANEAREFMLSPRDERKGTLARSLRCSIFVEKYLFTYETFTLFIYSGQTYCNFSILYFFLFFRFLFFFFKNRKEEERLTILFLFENLRL